MTKSSGSISDPDIFEATPGAAELVEEKTQIRFDFSPADDPSGSSAKGPAYDPFPGRILAQHYKIESRIGEGGMCAVYRAVDLTLNRKVAIKVLLPGRLMEDGLLRFQREAKTVGALDHPNIMRIHELSTTERGEPFIVMELLEGRTLADLFKTEEVLFERFIEIAHQCASALACAHSNGFVHRDVKPSNIIVSTSPKNEYTVKLVDFGIAHNSDAFTMQLTQTGDVFGSPYYMSPEQCRGEKIDQRSDIYSFGCVLYEWATGRVPFQGASALDTLRMHAEDTPNPPGEINRKLRLSAELDHIILKCLAKNPADRYQTAEELDSALTELMQRKNNSARAILGKLARRLKLNKFKRDGRARLLIALSTLLVSFALWAAIPAGQSLCDKIYSREDVLGQRALNIGDYKNAREKMNNSLTIARYFPVSRKTAKVAYACRNIRQLAIITHDKNLISEAVKTEHKRTVASRMQALLQLGKQKEHVLRLVRTLSAKSKDEIGARTSAQEVIQQSVDLITSYQVWHKTQEAFDFGKEVLDGTAMYVDQTDKFSIELLSKLAKLSRTADPSHFDDWMSKGESQLEKASGLSEIERAKILGEFASSYVAAGRAVAAERCIDNAITTLRLSGLMNTEVAADVYLQKSKLDKYANRNSSSDFYLAKAQEILKSAPPGSYRDVQFLLSEISVICKGAPSLQKLEYCMSLLDKLDSYHRIDEAFANALCQTGDMCARLQKPDQAKALYLRAAAIASDFDARSAASAFSRLALFYTRQAKYAEAAPYFVEAANLTATVRGAENFYVGTCCNLSTIYLRQGNAKRALEVLKKAEEYLHYQTVDSEMKSLVYRKLSEVYKYPSLNP